MTPPIERATRREHAAVADALASALLADPVDADIVLPGEHRQRALLDRLGFVPGAVIRGLASARPVAMLRPHARRMRRAA